MQVLIGGCQCGAVRYRTSGPVLSHVVCHCQSCRRTTGALSVAWFTVARSAMTFTQGKPAVRTSSVGVLRGRCLSCGTQLTYESTEQEPGAERTIDVTTCSLDEPAALTPDASIWIADEIPWSRNISRLPRYPFLRGHGWIEPPSPMGDPGIRLRQVNYSAYRETLLSVRVPVLIGELKWPVGWEEDDRDVGCIQLVALHADHAVATARIDLEWNGKIGRVVVLPAYRNKGIGRALIRTMHDLARAAALRSVWCHAPVTSVPFFELMGYRPEGDPFMEAGVQHQALRRKLPI
jgi:predicted GNAT family N-acyltransferase